jgi:hypothetical protein
MSVCLCTLAIPAPYRRRARRLLADPAPAPWVVLTDDPEDFSDLAVCAIRHEPTGPMAIDYLRRIGSTGKGQGAAAYHDKRFVVRAALQDFDTAIFFDADSRVVGLQLAPSYPPGIAVVPVVRSSIAEHLEKCGPWRRPAFETLARDLAGDIGILETARWCHETCYAVTRDGHEGRFFGDWERGAELMQRQGVFSGEGGVMGLAAACAGWTPDYDVLRSLVPFVEHEGGGPKGA